MINRSQICNRADVLRQLLGELIEQATQVEELQQKLQTAEKKAPKPATRACRHSTRDIMRTAPYPPR